MVRARTGGRVDSVVKLRGPEPDTLKRETRRFPNLTVEVDALPEHSWWTTAVARDLRPSAVRAAVRGRRPLRTLLSGEQRRFLRAHARGCPACLPGSGAAAPAVAGRRTAAAVGGRRGAAAAVAGR